MTPVIKELIEIPCYAADRNDIMSISAFMDYAQQVAGKHADTFGFGHDDLIKEHIVWIVYRMHICFLEPLKWKDIIELSTWHKGLEHGVYYRREYVAKHAGTDRIAAVSTSYWLLLDINTRKLVRNNDKCDREETILTDNAVENPCMKIRIPRSIEAEKAFMHTVRRSEIDRNGHANNARYAAWAMDALPESAADRPVREFDINFNHEILLGDEVGLLCYKESENIFYVEGRLKDTTAFITKIVL